ncbi:hypothetical protein ACH47Z_44750 [Streptomyces sp. NPDC020192]|uniref:hypothetical protein n=1 Tax=Streptomyces sp. NPDC020192 TaxID=3365066 RepID=UPI0037B51665
MRPPKPRTLDEALGRARVRHGVYSRSDREASRRRIAEQLRELGWVQALADPAAGQRTVQRTVMLHERAGQDLRALCQGVIHDDEAARRITRFDETRDPGGALAFACLLLLADYEEGAQFWLQYAAGGGQATGAVCLYLLHLHRGDWRDARHWAKQIAVLEHEPCQYAPIAHEVVDAIPGPAGVAVYLDLPDDVGVVSEDAVRDAVDILAVDTLDGFGAIPQPNPALADQLQDLMAH